MVTVVVENQMFIGITPDMLDALNAGDGGSFRMEIEGKRYKVLMMCGTNEALAAKFKTELGDRMEVKDVRKPKK